MHPETEGNDNDDNILTSRPSQINLYSLHPIPFQVFRANQKKRFANMFERTNFKEPEPEPEENKMKPDFSDSEGEEEAIGSDQEGEEMAV